MIDAELSPIKRALLEQRRLKARIEELERAQSAPIAVIGVGCRFPGASGPGAFWRLLQDGVDAISDMPGDRWNVETSYDPDPEAPGKIATRFGGYLKDIDQFDPHAFGISPREAETMDPQQRLLLEVTWETLEHAGWAADRLAGSQTGVFVGIGTSEYLQRYGQRGAIENIDAYLATGNAHSVASGRISYLLGLQGPSISIDTACSSSLVAIHLGCESIRSGSSRAALAGGVGILLGNENYISLSRARMMAPDGRCKTFDARADGFVRSEGCGMVILKRLDDAQNDGDRILAVIRGTACNQDGRSNGITAPNGPSQQAVIRAALANARIEPSAVGYVEAHGTGTVLGDPIEVDSLTAVLGHGRRPDQQLLIGSVKTNLGHLEAAAGVAGFIKAVLAVHHGEIPSNLHYHTPNPHIDWESAPYLRVPTAAAAWDSAGAPRVAGVSAFGFSGTNAHIVLEQAPGTPSEQASRDRPLHVLALSAKTDVALRLAASDLATHLSTQADALADVCYAVNTSRAALPHRACLVAATAAEMQANFAKLVAGQPDDRIRTGVVAGGAAPRVLFVLTGDASRDTATVKSLYETQPAFRAATDACDAVLAAAELPTVASAFAGAAIDARTLNFVARYASSSMWSSWGIAPDAVLGSGVGDYVAATIAKTLSLEAALSAASGRSAAGVPDGNAPELPVFSGVLGRRVGSVEAASIGQWGGQDASPQQIDAALAAAKQEGFDVVVDMSCTEWSSLAAALCDFVIRGATVDWRAFDRGYGRRRVSVPTSPWIRQRYWFAEGTPAPSNTNDARERWLAVTAAAQRQASVIPIDLDLGRFAEQWRALDAATTDAVARALSDMGLFANGGERQSVDSAMMKAGILPRYRRLMTLWLERLARHGILESQGEAYVAPAAGIRTNTNPGSLIGASGADPVLRAYLQRCDQQMAAIVTGRQGALETLFPAGSFETADFLYRDWGLARYYNSILESAAASLRDRIAHRPLRVLEIGAGTGGTAATLVPLLAGTGAEYWFTDVSEGFFGRAEQAFAALNTVRYHRFDLDDDPAAQGIPTGYFDLVVAANAVHAAKNLGPAIERARSLLAPDGVLMLYEVTTHFDWFEMSVGLIEGWQHHSDDLRGSTPLLGPSRWEDALRDRGFDRVAFFPQTGSPTEILGHHVIVASSSATAASAPAVVTTSSPAFSPSIRHDTPDPAPHASTGSLAGRLSVLTHSERKQLLQELVQRQVIRVMRLRANAPPPAADDRLMSIGMDSLMAVELKKLLTKELDGAVSLPSTLIFDHPTIDAIATLILSSLGFDGTERPTVVAPRATDARRNAAVAAIVDLSDAEVEALLNEQLKDLA